MKRKKKLNFSYSFYSRKPTCTLYILKHTHTFMINIFILSVLVSIIWLKPRLFDERAKITHEPESSTKHDSFGWQTRISYILLVFFFYFDSAICQNIQFLLVELRSAQKHPIDTHKILNTHITIIWKIEQFEESSKYLKRSRTLSYIILQLTINATSP